MRCVLAFIPVAASAVATSVWAQRPAAVTLRPGLIIERSVRVAPNVYRLRAAASLDSPLVIIRGDDVTVDLSGSTLLGAHDDAAPDEAQGVAILIDGGRNVTLRGGRIGGYRLAIRARGTRGLRIVDSDLSRNWKPRLYSVVEHESLVDWLSFHHNEQNEWLRFGAAMYLEDVHGGDIRGNVVEQGMNALLMTRSDSLLVRNNDFSFNSGLGIGLYRSSDNRIMHNEIDYNVRGYSHGFYHRGQDSAGILVYEQSCRNVIAYNSVTHGGDGLFLWAGQSTMDTGQGGANDNVVFANDFSYAPANGIEATFSRNAFVRNRVVGSDYGVWGGYSFDTEIVGNELVNNVTGVAIEHGQANRIEGNTFRGDTTAIRLWADSIEPSDWGYPKRHDTRSRDNVIARNLFDHVRVGVRASRSDTLTMRDNRFAGSDSDVVQMATSVVRSDAGPGSVAVWSDGELPPSLRRRIPGPMPNARGVDRAVARLPRSAIVVDEWGPYDWRTPKLWPLDSTHAVPLRLAVLAPPGSWRVDSTHGIAQLSKRRGRIPRLGEPDTLIVTPRADSFGDWSVSLRYQGASGGPPVHFTYGRFEPRIEWTERVFAWTDSTDPRAHSEAFDALLRGAPLVESQMPRLDFVWYRPPIKAIPQAHWALEATGGVDLPPGEYTLHAISDDAIRVWVDGRLAIDDWRPHESRVDVAPLGAGRHDLRVQYLQVDGWAELRVDILHGAPTSSPGSPGPH
jgi:parallel beta-helix repeat protein